MFCKYCGNELPETSEFCPKCGKNQGNAEFVPQTVYMNEGGEYSYGEDDSIKKEKSKLANDIMIYGIIAVAASVIVGLPLVGLIFACIAKSKLKKYALEYEEIDGRANIGKILSTVGLIVSIVYIVLIVAIISLYLLMFGMMAYIGM